MKKSSAKAYANVALVKYFGKRDLSLNLPAAPSLSMTVSPLATTTTVQFDDSLQKDMIVHNGNVADEKFSKRITGFLNILREKVDKKIFASIDTGNNFPTAAGLASSASGFAALVVAASSAIGLELSNEELSVLARRGSGSACRSLFEGICVWDRGEKKDGSDSFARSIMPADQWDLRMVVGVTQKEPKEVGSTEAMEHTRYTSPYYEKWIESATNDVRDAIGAVSQKDFTKLGEITERSALAMHAAIMASKPGIIFLKGTTIEACHLANRMRKNGVEVYFTCDAGPQPKFLCHGKDVSVVEEQLGNLPGVQEIISCKLANGASLI